MNYFPNVHSFAGLKKQYRVLALAHHPDRGGDTALMQEINLQFERLYPVWEQRQPAAAIVTGYEDDLAGASAREYTDYVHREYRWQGHNYKGQSNAEIIDIIRKWVRETYPRYRFSIRREDYNSFHINLLEADFSAFIPQESGLAYLSVNQYRIRDNDCITERAKEVLLNVYEFVKSWHFDDSDSMTDYFHTNFYLSLGIGSDRHPYKAVPVKLKGGKGETTPKFSHPEGKAHRAVRQALGKSRFAAYETRGHGNIIALGEDRYLSGGEAYFSPLYYSSCKTAQKRMDKLLAAGIRCRLSGSSGGFLVFSGYTEETECALEAERREAAEALNKWNIKQNSSQNESR